MTLTKADIIAQVYASGLLTKSEAAGSVERTLSLVKGALSSQEEVLISGFGKWSVRAKSERRGRNPQTGEPLILPSRKVVTFRPSRVLKAKILDSAQGPQDPPESTDSGEVNGSGNKVLRPGYF